MIFIVPNSFKDARHESGANNLVSETNTIKKFNNYFH